MGSLYKCIKPLGAILFALILILAQPISSSASSEKVTVRLLKKHDDAPSMAAAAIKPEGELLSRDGGDYLRLTFLPLDLMGKRGFLGDATLDGQPGKVLETYSDRDAYNGPDSKDAKVRNKPYPKVMEFPVDRNKNPISMAFYVPVMGEMGMGEQEARLVLEIQGQPQAPKTPPAPKNPPSPSEIKPQEAPAQLEDGVYTLPAHFWHDVEDKASMGDGALDHVANLKVTDGKAEVYLGTKPLSVGNIQASLTRVFVLEGDRFVPARAASYDLRVAGEAMGRPSVFSFTLTRPSEFIPVKVDPKVAPMGDEPISARLKLDFNGAKRIKESEARLIERTRKGTARPNPKEAHRYTDKGVEMETVAGSYEEPFEFYANQLIGGEKARALGAAGVSGEGKVFRILTRKPIAGIPRDYRGKIQDLGQRIQPKKKVTLTVPIPAGDYEVIGPGKEKSQVTSNGKLQFKADALGDFVLVAKGGGLAGIKPVPSMAIKSPAKTGTVRPVTPSASPSTGTLPSSDFGGSTSGDPSPSLSTDTPTPLEVGTNSAPEEAEGAAPDAIGMDDNAVGPSDGESGNSEGGYEFDEPMEEERYGLIVLFLILIGGCLAGGVYLTRKYYLAFMDEVAYEEEEKGVES